MHILFFTYDVPYPPNSGGKTRAYNLIKYAKKDATVSLFSFTRPGYDLTNLEILKDLGIRTIELFPRKEKKSLKHLPALISKTHSIFYSLYFDKSVKQTLLSFVKKMNVDLVHCESFYTGFYLGEDLRKLGVKQVYGSENIEYKLYEEGLRSVPKVLVPILRRETEKIKHEEIMMAKRADTVFAVTDYEKDFFTKVTETKVFTIENGVSVEDFPRIPEKNHTKLKLLFIGNFRYFPNRDAAEYLLKHIWTKLSRDDFHLTIVGNGATELPDNTIEKVEYVPDIYDAYAMSDVFISPMRYGGGTNFKVLEAMAAGLPVVALSDKVKGIDAEDRKELCVANNAEEFVDNLIMLKNDVKARHMIGKNARELVLKRYSWETIGTRTNTIWQSLVDEAN